MSHREFPSLLSQVNGILIDLFSLFKIGTHASMLICVETQQTIVVSRLLACFKFSWQKKRH